MGNTSKNVEVIVVGAGLAGLSAAYHLVRDHKQKSVLVFDLSGQGVSSIAAGWATGGMFDNFTRISHVHHARAAEVWGFGNAALKATQGFVTEHQINSRSASRERLIVSAHELEEALQAELELNQFGFQAKLLTGPELGLHKSRVLARQQDGAGGAFIDTSELLAALQTESGINIEADEIIGIAHKKNSMQVRTASGRTLDAEIIVLANHLGVRRLLPEVASAYVPFVEQWIEVKFSEPLNVTPGYCFSANHGYEWGVFLDQLTCRIGGGRFLRKLAGIGMEMAPVEDKITDHLVACLGKTFSGINKPTVTKVVAGLDCRPCDELPIIGPMFGDSRILLLGGFMGLGIPQGFLGGKCLADLIVTGQCAALPRLIYPERLRSL